MKKLLIAIATILSLSLSAQAGDLRIQFQTWIVQGQLFSAAVSVKNTTNIDFATVTWSCEFRDREGYKTGGGVALLHMVPKNSIAYVARQPFYNNGNARVSIKCELLNTEELSRENARLYRAQPGQNHPANAFSESGIWSDKAEVNGIALEGSSFNEDAN
jgi:hypothetical protein